MALNLWTIGGQPTAYSPLPLGTVNKIALQIGTYILTFQVKSASSSTLRLGGDNSSLLFDGVNFKDITLSPSYMTISTVVSVTLPQNVYIRDRDSKGDLIVTGISLVRAPLPVKTINGIDGFGTALNGSVNGSLRTVPNFTGKISGSLVGNPHVAKRTTTNSGSPSLLTPSSNIFNEMTDPQYPLIFSQDGSVIDSHTTGNGQISQHIFSFNIISAIESGIIKIPASDTAGKLQWIQNNLKSMTCNWYGYGATSIATPLISEDFTGKITGSVVANPNIARRGSAPALATPPNATSLVELLSNTEYSNISSQDGTILSTGGNSNISGNIGQMMFSFNLIEHVKRNYGFTPDASWLVNNISSLAVKVYGDGSGPSGNKMSLQLWRTTGVWTTVNSTNVTTSSTVTSVAYGTSGPPDVVNYVQNDGFVYAIVYTDASNGVTPSNVNVDYVKIDITLATANKASLTRWNPTGSSWDSVNGTNLTSSVAKVNSAGSSNYSQYIDSNGISSFMVYSDPSNGVTMSAVYTDYVELEIITNQGAILNSLWTLDDHAQLVNDSTLVLNANGINQFNTSPNYSVIPNAQYYFSCNVDNPNGQMVVQIYDSNNVRLSTPSTGPITMPSNASYVNFRLGNPSTTGLFTFTSPMLTLGSLPVPYEPKHGTLMVMPIANKNMIEPVTYVANTSGGLTYNKNSNSITVVNASYGVIGNNVFKFSFAPNTTYTFSVTNIVNTFRIQLYKISDGSSFYDSGQISTLSVSFTTGPDQQYYFKMHGVTNAVLTNPQLEKGAIQTTFTPYTVQLNKVPSKVLAKKNLVPDFNSPRWIQDSITTGGIMTVNPINPNRMTLNVSASAQGRLVQIPVVNGATYTFSIGENTGLYRIYKGAVTTYNTGILVAQDTIPASFTVDASYNGYVTLRLTDGVLGNFNFGSAQLEQGSVATTYEPYTITPPKASTGLYFNGNTDYISGVSGLVPTGANSKTVEIWFSGDSTGTLFYHGQASSSNMWNMYINGTKQVALDRGGGGTFSTSTIISGMNQFVASYDGTNIRVYLNGIYQSLSTNTLNIIDGIFKIGDGYTGKLKGTIYNAYIYNRTLSDTEILNNYNGYRTNLGLILNHDFTNSNTIAGTTIFKNPIPQNLIPSLDDPSWIINSVGKVLGKDVLHIDATVAYQWSTCLVNVLPNTTYLLVNGGGFTWEVRDANQTTVLRSTGGLPPTFTTGSNVTQVCVRLGNLTSSGPYDFIRPQLYQLTGLEGTANGSPKQLNKQSKRILYAKR